MVVVILNTLSPEEHSTQVSGPGQSGDGGLFFQKLHRSWNQ